jgi:hypothetical protein
VDHQPARQVEIRRDESHRSNTIGFRVVPRRPTPSVLKPATSW